MSVVSDAALAATTLPMGEGGEGQYATFAAQDAYTTAATTLSKGDGDAVTATIQATTTCKPAYHHRVDIRQHQKIHSLGRAPRWKKFSILYTVIYYNIGQL